MTLAVLVATAFVAGLAGSGHCVAMCGAIAGALARGGGTTVALLNSLGRVTSYALAGALAAALTTPFGWLLDAQQLRVGVVWTSAVVLVFLGLRMAGFVRGRSVERGAAAAWRLLQPATRLLARVPKPLRPFAAGLVWGWLPCGMAYAMLLLAAARADALEGALAMAAFGLGTVPLLTLGAGLVGVRGVPPRLRVAAGVAIAVVGVASAGYSVLPPDHAAHAGHAAHRPHAHAP